MSDREPVSKTGPGKSGDVTDQKLNEIHRREENVENEKSP
jgi:hypothetical protein